MKSLKKILFTTILFILIFFIANEVYATTITASPSSATVGQPVKITVSVPNVNTIDLTATISGAGTSGTIRIVDGSMTGEAKTFSKSATVTPTSEGTITVTISSSSNAVLNGKYVNVAATKTISVTKPAENPGSSNSGGTTSSGNNTPAPKPSGTTTKSNVATLEKLRINPNGFSGFKTEKYNYSVTVGNEVDKVTVYATTTHNKATWSVSGANVAGVSGKTVSLKEGTNNIYINVKAEDGTKAKYTIAVTRKSAEGEIIPNVIEDQEFEQVGITEALGLKSLEVEKFNLNPEFAAEVYEYTITVENEELLSLEDLKAIMKYEANFENALIEVSSEKEDFEYGENLVYIIVKDAENEVAKYTLKVILEEKEEVLTIGAIEENTVTEEKTSIPKERIISIISMSLLGVISVIIMIRYYMVSQRLEIFENEIDMKDFENTKSTTTVKENVEVKEETEESRSEKIDKLTERATVEQESGFEYRRPNGRRRKGGKHRER